MAGRGLSVVPLSCVAGYERSGAIRVARPAQACCRNPVYAVLREESRERPAMVRTLALLRVQSTD